METALCTRLEAVRATVQQSVGIARPDFVGVPPYVTDLEQSLTNLDDALLTVAGLDFLNNAAIQAVINDLVPYVEDAADEVAANAVPIPIPYPEDYRIDDVLGYVLTLPRAEQVQTLRAVSRIDDGQISPGDEPLIHALPGWTWLETIFQPDWRVRAAVALVVAVVNDHTGPAVSRPLLSRAMTCQ